MTKEEFKQHADAFFSIFHEYMSKDSTVTLIRKKLYKLSNKMTYNNKIEGNNLESKFFIWVHDTYEKSIETIINNQDNQGKRSGVSSALAFLNKIFDPKLEIDVKVRHLLNKFIEDEKDLSRTGYGSLDYLLHRITDKINKSEKLFSMTRKKLSESKFFSIDVCKENERRMFYSTVDTPTKICLNENEEDENTKKIRPNFSSTTLINKTDLSIKSEGVDAAGTHFHNRLSEIQFQGNTVAIPIYLFTKWIIKEFPFLVYGEISIDAQSDNLKEITYPHYQKVIEEKSIDALTESSVEKVIKEIKKLNSMDIKLLKFYIESQKNDNSPQLSVFIKENGIRRKDVEASREKIKEFINNIYEQLDYKDKPTVINLLSDFLA